MIHVILSLELSLELGMGSDVILSLELGLELGMGSEVIWKEHGLVCFDSVS